MKQVAQALEYLAHCIANHKDYGDYFNYEDFAKEQFKQKGRGFVFIYASEFVSGYLSGSSRLVETQHKYSAVSESEAEEFNSFYQIQKAYNPDTEYALILVADRDKLPSAFVANIPNQLVYYACCIPLTRALKPSCLSEKQIQKRLKRMIAENKRLLIIDTSQPDFMGKNLEKWLRQVKLLQNQGKYIAVMIDSDDDNPYRSLPDDLKADVLPLQFQS